MKVYEVQNREGQKLGGPYPTESDAKLVVALVRVTEGRDVGLVVERDAIPGERLFDLTHKRWTTLV